MKPSLNKKLSDVSKKLMEEIAPTLNSDYVIRSVGVMAAILMTGVKEYEHGADILATEINEMRELFAAAAEVVEDTEIQKQVKTAASIHPTSLRISALEAVNDELKEVLITLHAHVEEVDTFWASELVERIWKHLNASATRRSELFPSFA